MSKSLTIHLLVPFYTGSHQRWADELVAHSRHNIRLFTLPGRHWKWRMHGASVTLAQQWLSQDEQPDLLFTTDMLDTATWLALTRGRSTGVPLAIYFHENQLTYPWSPADEDVSLQRDRHYAWINYTSALAADRICFNSAYHQESFLGALPGFLRAFPDFKNLDTVAGLRQKSQVLYLGMELPMSEKELTIAEPRARVRASGEATTRVRTREAAPTLLWNHRWEYDKRPDRFFALLAQLQDEGFDFQLIVLGEQFKQSPKVFARAQEQFKERILHWGYATSRAAYEQWLQRADILLVTGRQDFFGGSVVEAMHAGVYPLLPDRLAYPEHVPGSEHTRHLYDTETEALDHLRKLLHSEEPLRSPRFTQWVQRYRWEELVIVYDHCFEEMCK